MRILCPHCSSQSPFPVAIEASDRAVVCPGCQRRYALRTILVEAAEGRRTSRGFRYLFRGRTAGGALQLQSVKSTEALPVRVGSRVTIVRRGYRVEGIADQENKTWIPVTQTAPASTGLAKIALLLVWPITLLAAAQAFRLAEQAREVISGNPLGTAEALGVVGLLALLPALWWLLGVLFPDGPRRKRLIRDFEGFDDI